MDKFHVWVDWNRIDVCNFFLSSSPDQLRCCSCSAVGDWLEQKCLCDAFITFTFSKWFYHCLEKKAKKIILCCSLSQNLFFQHCLWKIKIFLSAMHSSFYFRKMFLLLSGKEKKSFFFLIMTFHLWFWKKNVLKEKIYFFPQSNINFHVKKSTVFVFLNKKLYLRVRTVFFTDAFITFHFSKCFFLCLRTKCHWWLSVPKMS